MNATRIRIPGATRGFWPSKPGIGRRVGAGVIIALLGVASAQAADDRQPSFRQLRPAPDLTAKNREQLDQRRKAAQSGDARAQFDLGWMYASGLDVPRDYDRAVMWWQKAAAQGLADAQLNLGIMYQAGIGVAKDSARAVEWYRKAADQGDAQSQSNLGFMYQNGEGVAQDAGQAVEWWRKAAELGHASAQYNLAVAYHNGEGVMEDFVESHKWVVIAAANASEDRQRKY